MSNRRIGAVLGLAVAASLAFASAACGTKADTPTATPTKSAKEVLADAAKQLQKTSFSFDQTSAIGTGSGSVDPAAKAATIKMNLADASAGVSVKMELLFLATDMYAKLDFGSINLPGLPPKDKWQHVDKTKLKNPKDLDIDVAADADPAGALLIFNNIATVEKVGDRQYKGTVDVSKATEAGIVDEDVVKDLADAAKTIPFEATLDDKNRLVALKLTIPAAGKVKAQSWDIKYSNFGSAPKLDKPPAAQVQEAPQALYDIFNS